MTLEVVRGRVRQYCVSPVSHADEVMADLCAVYLPAASVPGAVLSGYRQIVLHIDSCQRSQTVLF